MNNHNRGFTNIEYPPGLEREVLRILSKRIGRENAYNRFELLGMVRLMPGLERVDERQVRAAINELRKNKALICSTGGTGGGYWMAANYDEIDEYLRREVYARISDLNEQAQAMKSGAIEKWGEEITMQPRMF